VCMLRPPHGGRTAEQPTEPPAVDEQQALTATV
jgi:hypothetical protein